MPGSGSSRNPKDLRSRAEKTFRENAKELSDLSGQDKDLLLHELSVHQIELEMQNEELRRAQDEIERLRLRYFDLYEYAPVAYLNLDAKGIIQSANIAAAHLLGVDRRLLLEKPLLRWVVPEFRQAFHLHMGSVLASPERIATCELLLKRGSKQGQTVTALFESIAIQEDGYSGIRTVISDISEIRQAQREATEAHEGLENKVRERTTELEKSNHLLRLQVEETRRADEKVFQTLQMLNAHMNNSPLAVIEFDPDFAVTRWSSQAEKVFGWKAEEVIGRSIFDLPWVYREDVPLVDQVSAHLKSGKEASCRTTNRNYRKDGSVILCEWYNSAIYDSEGRLVSVLSQVLDITGRKGMEDRLRESEERWRTMARATLEGIAVTEKGRFVDINDQFAALSGYDLSELPGMEISTLIFEEDREKVMVNINSGRDSFLEHRMVRKDGRVMVVEAQARMFDYRGRKARFTSIRDVTDRKRMEEELRASRDDLERRVEERTRELKGQADLLNVTHDAIMVRSLDNRILWWNEAAVRMYGYTLEQAIGQESITFLKTRFPIPFDHIMAAITAEDHWEGDLIRVKKDGSEITVLSRWALQRDEKGNPLAIMETSLDMTGHRRMEEQLRQAEKMQAVGTLAGGIAHDFNNVLAIIMGNVEMAMEDIGEDHPASHGLEQILTATKRGRDLVRQILTFSRKSQGEKQPTDVIHVLRETFRLLRSSISTAITMFLDIQKPSAIVLGDPIQVQQILMNLAGNAAYAMRKTGGRLTISLTDVTFGAADGLPSPDIKPGRYVKLSVEDTGGGIPGDVRARLFEPFFSTKKPGQGAGMGLPVVYGIVKSYGGAIDVSSTVGKGSIFTVYLPAAEGKVRGEEEQPGEVSRGNNERILFIDDEQPLVEIAGAMLKKLGYQPTTLTDASRAWNLFLENPHAFDLVITDQSMPDIMGTALAKNILKIRPDIPIILCTGYSEVVSPETARKIGIREFVMKPLVKTELAETIRRALKDRTGGKAPRR